MPESAAMLLILMTIDNYAINVNKRKKKKKTIVLEGTLFNQISSMYGISTMSGIAIIAIIRNVILQVLIESVNIRFLLPPPSLLTI